MKKIAITGSIASGKSTVAKLLKSKTSPIFDADLVVKNLYKKKIFLKSLSRILKHRIRSKQDIRKLLRSKKIKLKQLEKFIHPKVRRERKNFIRKNINKKMCFFEIPLLFESKLQKNYHKCVFVFAPLKKRKKLFIQRGGNIKHFNLFDKRQIQPQRKIQKSDYVIYNDKSLKNLKEKVKILKLKLMKYA